MAFLIIIVIQMLNFLNFIGFNFLENLNTSLKLKENSKRKRFEFIETSFNSNARKSGLLPQKQEWLIEKCQLDKNETLFFYGGNSDEQTLILKIRRRLQSNNRCLLLVNMYFKDSLHSYEFNDCDLIENKPSNRYEIRNFSLQLLSPFRRWRLCFSGILRRTDLITKQEGDIFVTIRMLWCSLSPIFDFKTDIDVSLICQTVKQYNLSDKDFFEDRYEQYGQFKGTFQVESEALKKVFLWGNKCKTVFDRNHKYTATIQRLFGYVKDGIGVHCGVYEDNNCQKRFYYGHCFTGVSFLFPITQFKTSLNDFKDLLKNKKGDIQFVADGSRIMNTEVDSANANYDWFSVHKLRVNGFDGIAVLVDELDFKSEEEIEYKRLARFDSYKISVCERGKLTNTVVHIGDPSSINVSVSGGKGMSLSQLKVLENQTANEDFSFVVPRGVILTTNAYKCFLDENFQLKSAIENLQHLIWSRKYETIESVCNETVDKFHETELPNIIKNELKLKLANVFGENTTELEQRLFSVRSSATCEDGEQMSAAGQMTTFLGVKGFSNICKSIVNCFASQFTRIAVEYRHGYAQLIDSTMAVVVQDMVDCEVSGVLFTCNPLNGDTRNVIITANYGLCESVVSSMSEPDTVTVLVNPITQTVIDVQSVVVGTKKHVVKLLNDGGTVQQESQSDSQRMCSLNNKHSIYLTKIGLFLNRCFGSARDIEWAIKDDQIYILQSRPVTNLSKFSDWELMHELDSSFASEFDIFTRANVGEVMPGALSYLFHTFTLASWSIPGFIRQRRTNYIRNHNYCPFAVQFFGVVHNHFFFNLRHRAFNTLISEGNNSSILTKGMQYSVFGHEVRIDGFKLPSIENTIKTSVLFKAKVAALLFESMIFSAKRLRETNKKYESFKLILDDFTTSESLFEFLVDAVIKIYEPLSRHNECTLSSSLWNVSLMAVLTQGKKEFTSEMLVDISNILGNNQNILSVEVPQLLRDISQSVEDKNAFLSMSDSQALDYLLKGKTKASLKFKEFLKIHGHRGYKEFDPLAVMWIDDPSPLIKSLKANLSTEVETTKEKKTKTISETIESLKSTLTKKQKLLLKYLLLPFANRAVSCREESKSLLIKSLHQFRIALWKLAEIMCFKEGRIPERDLLFFLKFEEIEKLVKERDAYLISRAKQRKKIFKLMNEYKFDEITKGPDFKPRERKETVEMNMKCPLIKGTQVCVGKVEGRAFVAQSFDDVVHIEHGDILVTYSTDIGWSPYFPMLSGIVTEIGGLVSHGAVIAREYGLPCIVGVEGATTVLKTGDIILLNAENGTIVKL